jgi:hypothetical protein
MLCNEIALANSACAVCEGPTDFRGSGRLRQHCRSTTGRYTQQGHAAGAFSGHHSPLGCRISGAGLTLIWASEAGAQGATGSWHLSEICIAAYRCMMSSRLKSGGCIRRCWCRHCWQHSTVSLASSRYRLTNGTLETLQPRMPGVDSAGRICYSAQGAAFIAYVSCDSTQSGDIANNAWKGVPVLWSCACVQGSGGHPASECVPARQQGVSTSHLRRSRMSDCGELAVL